MIGMERMQEFLIKLAVNLLRAVFILVATKVYFCKASTRGGDSGTDKEGIWSYLTDSFAYFSIKT